MCQMSASNFPFESNYAQIFMGVLNSYLSNTKTSHKMSSSHVGGTPSDGDIRIKIGNFNVTLCIMVRRNVRPPCSEALFPFSSIN